MIKIFTFILFLTTQINCNDSNDIFSIYDCLHENDDSSTVGPSCNDTINSQLSNCTCGTDVIDCSNKGFYSIPTNLTKLPSQINRLLFSNNSISSLAKLDLNNSSKITVLNLKRNRISFIEPSFFDSLTQLVYLSFCGNDNLTSLNSINANLTRLETLEVNNLKESLVIKDTFFTNDKFTNLSRLDLNNANLKITSKTFGRLDKLLTLRLDSNQLAELPCDSFALMPKLELLNLNNNNLHQRTDVSKNCFMNLKSLHSLFLNGNSLNEEDLIWFDLTVGLQALDLSNNKFTRFPYTALRNVKDLTILRININETYFTPNTVDKSKVTWPNLSYLDLSNSNISFLTKDAFVGFSNELTDLILKNSRLKQVNPDAFNDLNHLNNLDLSNNNLQTISRPTDEKKFDYKLLNGNVKLSHNSFQCNQLDVEWFIQLYDDLHFEKNLTCSLFNGSSVNMLDYLKSHRVDTNKPVKTRNILGFILLALVFLVVSTIIVYFVRRKQVKQRQQQYRYRFFTERQDDGFDTDNVPVYRDCTVSLRIKDTDDVSNFNSNVDTSSTAALTEQRDQLR